MTAPAPVICVHMVNASRNGRGSCVRIMSGAVHCGVKLGSKGCGSDLIDAALHQFAQKDLRDTEIRTGRPNADFELRQTGAAPSATLRALSQRKAPFRDRGSGGDARSPRESIHPRGSKKSAMRPMISGPIGIDLLRAPKPLNRVHDDQLGVGGCQIGIQRRIAESLDVVEIFDAFTESPELGFRARSCRSKVSSPRSFAIRTTGARRPISISGGTGWDRGLLDAAPTSITSAPFSIRLAAWANAASGSRNFGRVRERVLGNIQYAEDLGRSSLGPMPARKRGVQVPGCGSGAMEMPGSRGRPAVGTVPDGRGTAAVAPAPHRACEPAARRATAP